ncbi:unnamed protein product [Rhizophagus irregularis]|nr:unnamed protein product [Rhizophagus irregularis]
MNFFSQETLDAAKELTVSFRNRGLTWHSPDQVKNLCHVCGRLGCSPSQCSPRPAKKASTQLDKLYSRFKAGPQRGRTSDHSQRSSSRSRSRSRNARSNSQRKGPSNGTQQSKSRPHASASSSQPVTFSNQQNQPIGRPIVTSQTQQPEPTITPEDVAALRQQILELSKTIHYMDERIDWFSAQLESHEYRIVELENTVYPDNNAQSSYENFESYQDNHEERQESDELYNWDDADRVTTKLPPRRSMIMQISPDTSFSHDAPANVLSSRHLPFPTSEVLQPRRPQVVSQPINFHKELDNLTSTQELIHGKLGSIMSKLDGLSPLFLTLHHLLLAKPTPTPMNRHRLAVSPTKQLNLFSILLSRALHSIILTETNLCSPAHRYICNPYLNFYDYHSWFTHSPIANRHSGVGIILHSSLAMYVVKKKFFSDRLIGLTLQLPGKRNVLIIGGYVPPVSSSNRSIIADCYSTLISWIRSARSSDHSVLLGGDLNADLETFLKQLTAAHPGSSPLNPLFKFLHEQNFDDLCELDSSSLLPSPTFRSSSSGSLSRLDYIWISPFFPIPHLWSSVLDLTDVISTDHFLIIAHFDFLELKDHHAPSYMKQRQRCRTSYNFHSASPAQKESFALTISAMLPDVSLLPRAIPLNQLWHQFKSSLLSASRSCFPRINISLTSPKDIPHELQPYTRLANSLSHFMMTLGKKANISQLQHAWSRFFVDFKPKFLRLFSNQSCLLNNLPDPLKLDEIFILSNLSFDEFRTQFKKSLRKLKKFLSAGLTLEFKKFKTTSMKSAIAERNENFYENKGQFISSSLNRERCCIVLDRVLVVNISDGPKLLVAPEEIKAAAITHFQNVVGPSVSPFDSLSTLPLRWKKRYAPLEQFQESLYDPVMAHISVSELREVISLSPTHKAPGPSSIPYEWFKILPDTALEFLCELMNRCLDSSDIPEDWRLASIAPIPKPHEFDALLKNTRPITLLETARKLLVKIINNRLSNILALHHVLQGNNFAGLPGSSVNTPINVLDGIIKSHRLSRSSQELWILSQDISKAFDSIDLRMLRLAFNRLRFPDKLSNFIISLFTNRKNRIFTPYGPTSFYNVLIGIDQGEVISPLLWTIYFDPLLTELSESAISPYLWSSHIPMNILALNDCERQNLVVPITQLTYMDDSTLFSSSLDGLQQLLSIARDFYFLNNITANFSKYELVSSLSTSSPITFSLISEFPLLVDNVDFQLTPLKLSSSFRFLGVWFNLQGSPSFVVSQVKDIYNSFVSTIQFKKLTSAQLAYLHSAVILPKVHFRSQVTYLPEATLLRIVGSYYGLHRKLLSVSCTFPSLALTSKLFTEDVNPYTYLCQRLISRLMAWISAYSSGSVYSDWIALTFRALQVALKWPSSLDKILDFSRWSSSRRSIHHNWIFQALRILFESGLNIKLPVGLCLDLMPSHFVPLVTLSSELANSEKATWLFSSLCKTPSWFTRLTNIPNLISYLPASSDVAAYPPYLLTLQGSALDVIDEQISNKSPQSLLLDCRIGWF